MAFGWQIYFDFSGYTDMARGIAAVDGLPDDAQLQQPLHGHGPGRFLEPLAHQPVHLVQGLPLLPAGRQPPWQVRTYINMFITMVISGIWHGAAWTFVVWGGLHALGRCLTRELEQTEVYQQRIPRLAKQLAVFTFVTFTWIFFRAQSLTDAWLIISRIFTTGWADPRFPLVMAVLVLAVWVYQLLYTSGSSLRSVDRRGAGARGPGRPHDRVPGDRRPAEHQAVHLFPVLIEADGESTMGEQDSSMANRPSAEPDAIALSNGIRLTGREWLGLGLFAVVILAFAPSLWHRTEKFALEPDYRIPHDLSNDYWLYERFAGLAADHYDTLLIGDSVIWGEYVTRQETLSHYLNELAGQERYANLGLDGAHPLALGGLVEFYAESVSGKNVLLQCNPLWMSSRRADLQDDRRTSSTTPGWCRSSRRAFRPTRRRFLRGWASWWSGACP